MSKKHIALVGGQPAPVYTGIVYLKPDSVFLICSQQTKEVAERIQNEFPKIHIEIILMDPVDFDSTEKIIENLSERLGKEEITLNITGGTKLWTYYFTVFFYKKSNAKLFYIDQNNKIRNLTEHTTHLASYNIDALLSLYGTPLKKYKKYTDFCEKDFRSIQEIQRIRKFNYKEFNALTRDNQKSLNNKGVVKTDNGSFIREDRDKGKIHMQIFNTKGLSQDLYFDSSQKELLFNSGWFELEVAQLLHQWNKVKEIRINCLFSTKKGEPKNEIDIIVETETKLLFVECKTQIHKETDIDKFRSAVTN